MSVAFIDYRVVVADLAIESLTTIRWSQKGLRPWTGRRKAYDQGVVVERLTSAQLSSSLMNNKGYTYE